MLRERRVDDGVHSLRHGTWFCVRVRVRVRVRVWGKVRVRGKGRVRGRGSKPGLSQRLAGALAGGDRGGGGRLEPLRVDAPG